MLSRIKLSFLISGTLHVYYMYVELKQYYKIFHAILKIICPTHKALTAHFPCLLHALQIKGGDVNLVLWIQAYVWLLVTLVAYSHFTFKQARKMSCQCFVCREHRYCISMLSVSIGLWNCTDSVVFLLIILSIVNKRTIVKTNKMRYNIGAPYTQSTDSSFSLLVTCTSNKRWRC
jgi:hypothetical protein